MRLAAIIVLIISGSLATSLAESPRRSAMIDLALTAEGHLVSRCQDEAGQPLGGVVVMLTREDQPIASAVSREDGWFILRKIDPGSYRLTARHWSHPVRIWSESAAPPAGREPIVVFLSSENGSESAVGTGTDLSDGENVPASSDAADAPLTPADDFTNDATAEAPESDAASAADSPVDHRQPVIPLKYDEGARRKSADTASAAELQQSPAPDGADDETTHAHHTLPVPVSESRQPLGPRAGRAESIAASEVTAPAADAPFDPLARTGGNSQPAPQSAAVQPSSPPVPQGATVATQSAAGAAVIESAPSAPPPVASDSCDRCIPAAVGPTVGDVVVTSIGVAGITLGIIGIHKYENRKVRRIVSP